MKPLGHYLSTLRREKRPVRFLAGNLLWRTGMSRFLTIDCGRYRLRFFPTPMSASYWIDPRAREQDHHFLASYLRPGDTVVDVGANIGALALSAAAVVGESGRVFAIEAHPRTFGFLRQNVELNRQTNVTLIHAAVGSEPGTVFISDKALDDQNQVTTGGEGVAVRAETLDALVPDTGAGVDLLKVDVEGFEKFVFEGAEGLLRRTRCVYFESLHDHCARFGYSPDEVFSLLRSRGFTLYRLHRRALESLPEGFHSTECEDMVAARDVEDLRRRVRDGLAL